MNFATALHTTSNEDKINNKISKNCEINTCKNKSYPTLSIAVYNLIMILKP